MPQWGGHAMFPVLLGYTAVHKPIETYLILEKYIFFLVHAYTNP